MNIIVLSAIIFTVALVHGQPCTQWSDNNAYNIFRHRHILQDNFNRHDLQAWRRYLVRNTLCGRVPTQSFIHANKRHVRQICSHTGRRVQNDAVGNLCISNSPMQVYDVDSELNNNVCTVTLVTPRQHNVVVACNIVANQCRPVHYEEYNNQNPSNDRCV